MGILTGAAGRALRTLTPLTTPTKGLDALVLVHRATPDMAKALGDDAAKALGKKLFDASRSGSTRTATSRETIRLGLEELSDAASATARKRMVIGTLGLGGALAGLLALRGAASGGNSVPMAPGPIGGHDAPAEHGTSV
ncbi:MAG: hypothetical protein JWL76_1891 [Thermoleophilia bacterium]|nr:hypothetical protein [Thermoleophilia bacterium]